jgi:hypothetical protein
MQSPEPNLAGRSFFLVEFGLLNIGSDMFKVSSYFT